MSTLNVKIGILLILSLCTFADVFSQEREDTVAKDLNEIVVESAQQKASVDKVIYRPATKVKNSAQNAIDLLQRMAIPQVMVNPVTNAVTTASGAKLDLFINYLPAREEDIRGMLTSDVRRVEYLDFPTDPRFHGAQHVVNFIVQEYEYGGYTKLYDRNFFFVDFSNYATVFSKFSYKKMTYDLYVAADNVTSHHVGNSEESTFNLPSESVVRKNNYKWSDFKYLILPVTFRAVYTSSKTQISNTLGFKFQNRYNNLRTGTLSISGYGNDYDYATDAPHNDKSLVWNGDYLFMLPKDWTLTLSPGFTYTHNISDYKYSTTIPGDTPIVNDATENAYDMKLNANLRKRFDSKHSINMEISGLGNINDLDYYGSSPYSSHMSQFNVSGMAGYTFSLPMFMLRANVGISGEFVKTNGQRYNDAYPFANVSTQYAPNGKNYFSLGFQYATNSPSSSERSPNVIQVNEFLYRTGSPLLKNSRFSEMSASYTFLPNNHFSLTAFADYTGNYNRIVNCYSIYDGGNALIQSYDDNGTFTNVKAGLNATFRLLNNSLIFQISPVLNHYHSSGPYTCSWNPFTCGVYGQYYFGKFNITAYYSTRGRSINGQTMAKSTNRSYYSISIGWSKEAWNLSVNASNLFTSRYDGTWTDISTPLYSSHYTTFNANYRRSVMLSATYTFGYGKKIQRGDEVTRQREAGSAIMH